MIKLLEKQTNRKFYGVYMPKLGWAIYKKGYDEETKERAFIQHVFLVEELFNERFTIVDTE